MDLIREHLIYKDVPITIEIDKLKTQEQYEVIRLLLASRNKKDVVSVVTSPTTNKYIKSLLHDLKINISDVVS
uniref:Uncharacterized protein n=1 Tax=viral metagenome TaxID=1070528 RepID=A0A6C0CHW1_9ZZZZ